jgi:hypothetical protein
VLLRAERPEIYDLPTRPRLEFPAQLQAADRAVVHDSADIVSSRQYDGSRHRGNGGSIFTIGEGDR